MDDSSRGPLIKKAKVLNKSPNMLNNILEPNYTISFSTKEGDPLTIASRGDSAIKDDDFTLKDNISTSWINNSTPNISISTIGNNNSSIKGYNSGIGANSSAIKNNISLITNADSLIALEPPINIYYFENYLLWIVDLDYNSF
jgi:hypothetical protein